MREKTHKSAVVLIPPREVWPPIQALRERYDRQVRRWMPHVTLLYPFYERAAFGEYVEPFRAALSALPPFEVRLATFRSFGHGRDRFTLWLAPEPAARLRRLQDVLQQAAPGCDDVRRYAGGFTPHLSVGQVAGRERLEVLRASLQKNWEPLTFRAEHISLIHRFDPPDDVFHVVEEVALSSIA